MRIFSLIYDFFAPRRWALWLLTLVFVLVCAMVFFTIQMEEDIRAMFPDGESDTAVDFQLLQKAPFTRKAVVDLYGSDPDVLTETADRLAKAMTESPVFGKTVSGPDMRPGKEMLRFLGSGLPSLFTEADAQRLALKTTPENIREQLRRVYDTLQSPEGWAMKRLAQIDPLDTRALVFDKLRSVNIIPKMTLRNDRFVSADGKHALVIADTDVDITDSKGAEDIIVNFETIVSRVVPKTVRATLISGHRYAVANASAIKRDVWLVMCCSIAGIVALFAIFLRNRRAIFVFLVPAVSFLAAIFWVSAVYEKVSAITIGFGSVLLGITVDFALHVWFSVSGGENAPSVAVENVSRPVIFGGLTTIGAFGVLLLSDLPGQRQLAVFSIAGICASLLLSLIVLPHLVASGKNAPSVLKKADFFGMNTGTGEKGNLSRKLIVGIWAVLLAFLILPAMNLHIDGDLRSLSLVPEQLRKDEEQLKKTWGNFRGTAMIFAKGQDLDAALEANGLLFSYLTEKSVPGVAGIAPILPSKAVQEKNRARHAAFWSEEKKESVQKILVEEGQKIGFSSAAFQPFLDSLSSNEQIEITPEMLRQAGFGDLVDSMVIPTDDGVYALTLLPDTTATSEVMAGYDRPEVRLVSQTRFGQTVSRAIEKDFIGFIVKASLAVLVLLGLLFRRPVKILIALVPVFTGLVFMFGVMGLFGIGFNLFNVAAAILVIGLGVDYGIYMVCGMTTGYDPATSRAVLVSGLTTIAGFGALVMAQHPALNSIGLTVLLGIGAAIPSALLIIPRLLPKA